MGEYFNVVANSRRISTSSADAQLWFDRGLSWTYGFNHDEAVSCFRRTVEHDPDCAMAWWGVALASGPFYNMPWEWFSAEEAREATAVCHEAARRAVALKAGASPVERGLIDAIARRFPKNHAVPLEEFERWERDYAGAMRQVNRDNPGDHDVATLFAEALITLTPWRLWDADTGEPAADSSTLEALEVVDRAIDERRAAGSPPHPGILHMHIHILEMSSNPERALPSAGMLSGVCPDAGHLEHMPCHIYSLCGEYGRAVDASSRSIAADRLFIKRNGATGFYVTSICHDMHMMMHAAMMSGRLGPAKEAADGLLALLTPELFRVGKPYMAEILEGYRSTWIHVLVRFGLWQEIIAEPPPPDPDLFCVTQAMHHYARGVAQAALGNVIEARQELGKFRSAVARVPGERFYFNSNAHEALGVGEAMLEGELAYREGRFDAAFDHLRAAVERSDALAYTEPQGWMHPPRHALGALLLEQGRIEEALDVYGADLGLNGALARCKQNPGNIWSLLGYAECLERAGRRREAAEASERVKLAAAHADAGIKVSCFCRRGHAQ